MSSTRYVPNAGLSREGQQEALAAFAQVPTVRRLGYTEADAYSMRLELFRHVAMAVADQQVYGATGWHYGTEDAGVECTFYVVTDGLLVGVKSSEPGRGKSHDAQGPPVKFAGPVLTPMSRLTGLEVIRLEFDHLGVPDLDFNARFNGVNEPVVFDRASNLDGEARRRVYHRLRDVLAQRQ